MTGIDYATHSVNPPVLGGGAATASAQAGEGFSFGDFLDIVNPLQHIPVVSAIYRAVTGDTIGEGEKIAGDTLYGGIWGFVSSLADTAFKAATGDYFGDTVLAALTGDSKVTAVADAAAGEWIASGPPSVLVPQREPVAAQDPALAVAAYGRAATLVSNVRTIN
jgi:hypothetical protein